MSTRHERRRLIFRGHVQGVFFRATTQSLAQRFDVTGFVRNLPDGSVECEAQGPPDQLAALLDAITREYADNISDSDQATIEPVAGEADFTIR